MANAKESKRATGVPRAAWFALIVLLVGVGVGIVTLSWDTAPDTALLTTEQGQEASEDEEHVAVVGTDERVKLLSAATGTELRTLYDPGPGVATGGTTVDLHPDGRTVFISVLHLDDCGKVLRTTIDGTAPEDLEITGRSAVVRPDGGALAYVPYERDSDGRCAPVGIAIKDLATGEEQRRPLGPGAPPVLSGFFGLAWHPDGSALAFVVGADEADPQLRIIDTTKPGSVFGSRRVVPPREAEGWTQPVLDEDSLYVLAGCCAGDDADEPVRIVRSPINGSNRPEVVYTFTGEVVQADFNPETGEAFYVTAGNALYRVNVREGSEPTFLAANVLYAYR